jgi:hypothetical protein
MKVRVVVIGTGAASTRKTRGARSPSAAASECAAPVRPALEASRAANVRLRLMTTAGTAVPVRGLGRPTLDADVCESGAGARDSTKAASSASRAESAGASAPGGRSSCWGRCRASSQGCVTCRSLLSSILVGVGPAPQDSGHRVQCLGEILARPFGERRIEPPITVGPSIEATLLCRRRRVLRARCPRFRPRCAAVPTGSSLQHEGGLLRPPPISHCCPKPRPLLRLGSGKRHAPKAVGPASPSPVGGRAPTLFLCGGSSPGTAPSVDERKARVL